jgi:uncharacterized protein YodC (DUF2158 family)
MEFTIKIWSQVRSKSGGPEMTVTSCTKILGTEYVTCKWKDAQIFYMADFSVESLELLK